MPDVKPRSKANNAHIMTTRGANIWQKKDRWIHIQQIMKNLIDQNYITSAEAVTNTGEIKTGKSIRVGKMTDRFTPFSKPTLAGLQLLNMRTVARPTNLRTI